MSAPTIPVAIVGASGYTGRELLRLLIMHPQSHIVCATSRQHEGQKISHIFPRFAGHPNGELAFIQPDIEAIEQSGARIAFLALPHGTAAQYAIGLLKKGIKVIDLSADFRLDNPEVYTTYYGEPHAGMHLLKQAVYGLPEHNKETIKNASLIASPGCYPTSILLPLIPLLKESIISPNSLAVFSMSGVSGAGKKANETLLFCECNGSVRAYGAPTHRHLSEIEQELSKAAQRDVVITFTPHLVPIHNGIATTIYAKLLSPLEKVQEVLSAYYASSPFVRLLGEGAFGDTKQVAGTNFADIGFVYDQRTSTLILSSAIDNLGKGAASQAVQSFNILSSIPQTTGLLHI